MKPLLKWAGGKSRLAGQLDDAFGQACAGTYFEPFVGSGAVFLWRRANERVSDSVLADANPKLVAFHAAIRDAADDVLHELSRLPVVDFKATYYDVREAFNAGPHTGPLHAARFLWLNRACFNGLYRENRDGGFNVPVGSYAEVKVPSADEVHAVARLLEGVELHVGSFEDLLRRAGRGDQVYCDPPYVPLTQSASFTAYCKDVFGMKEQRRLAQEALRASLRGATVVLSNHDLPVIHRELYPVAEGFHMHARPAVSRAISRDVSSRKAICEVIARIGPVPVAVA